jgi:hypothetical protein
MVPSSEQARHQLGYRLEDWSMRDLLMLVAAAIVLALLLAGINYLRAIVRGWRISCSPWF